MKILRLNRGLEARVDAADFERVSQYNWWAAYRGHTFYVDGWVEGRQISLHNFLMPEAKRVDHRDGNGLNNTRGNLRVADAKINRRGFAHKSDSYSSKFRGVYFEKSRRKWVAKVGTQDRRFTVGRFDSEEEAARARDAKALELFGPEAHFNF